MIGISSGKYAHYTYTVRKAIKTLRWARREHPTLLSHYTYTVRKAIKTLITEG